MKTPRVLFVCTFTGGRSLMAERFAKELGSGMIEPHSASFESGKIHPLAITVMKEIGIDLPTDTPKSVWDRYLEKEAFDWVVSLCHETLGLQQCPIFKENVDGLYAENAKRLSWSVPAFNSLSGTTEERIAGARKIRDQIKREVLEFLDQLGFKTDMP